MKVYALTDTGRIRPNNEDRYLMPAEGERFCAVADGMGGCNAGEVASRLAADTFGEVMRMHRVFSCAAVREAIEIANSAVYEEALCKEALRGMGTTFTSICEEKGNMILGHVGDSRAYLIREGEIEQITRDHSYVAELVRQGVITEEEAKHHPQRNLITRALGVSAHVQADVEMIPIRSGDVWLLCTDGLSGKVTPEEILAITQSDAEWQDKLHTLIELALDKGSRDNVTCMYVLTGEEQR